MTDTITKDYFQLKTTSEIIINQLPSNLDVTKNLFFYTRDEKRQINEAVNLVVTNIIKYWDDVGIPVKYEPHCATRVKQLLDEWRNFQKNFSKKSEEQKVAFKNKLDNLFDISHTDAANMTDPAKIDFLYNQRQPGRIGTITEFKLFIQSKCTFFIS